MPDLKPKQPKARIWDRLHKRLHIEISTSEITLLQSSGWLSRAVVVLHKQSLNADDLASEELLAAKLQLALKAVDCVHMNATISLADTLVRMWIVTPPANAATMADCKAAAALRFHGLYGEFAGDWELVADWDAQRPFLACALRRSLLQRLLALCAEFKLTLLSLDPHFVATWNRYRKELGKEAWMAILNKESLTLGAVQGGRLVALRSTTAAYEVMHTRAWIDQHLHREALLLNLTPPKKLQIAGVIPPQWQKNGADQIQCLPLGVVRSVVAPTDRLQKGAA